MSMKSTGPSSITWSCRSSRRIPSAGSTSRAPSTRPTISTRSRTPGASRNAGRWAARAMPPDPMITPRERRRSGDGGVGIALAVEDVAQRRRVPLVEQHEDREQQAHRHGHRPQVGGDVSREARHAEQHEEDVLSQPAAQGEQQLLPLAVLGAEPIWRPGLAQLPDQADGAGKQLRLPHDVIAIHPGAEPLKQRPPDGPLDRKSTRLNSSHGYISYAVFCLKKKTN